MKYLKQHKKLIAGLLKKAGMLKETKVVLSSDKYDYEISRAVRDAAGILKVGIAGNSVLLDAVRRYETRHCPIFADCPLPRCEGAVWCDVYNLGGSHGSVGSTHSILGTSVVDVPIRKRREIMFEILAQKTGYLYFQKSSSRGSYRKEKIIAKRQGL